MKTAYEMRISAWSSDVCSSDLTRAIAMVAAATMTVLPAITCMTRASPEPGLFGWEAGRRGRKAPPSGRSRPALVADTHNCTGRHGNAAQHRIEETGRALAVGSSTKDDPSDRAADGRRDEVRCRTE